MTAPELLPSTPDYVPASFLRPPRRPAKSFTDEPMFEPPVPDAGAKRRRLEHLKAETWPDGPPPPPWWWDKKSREQAAEAVAALLTGRPKRRIQRNER